MRITPSRLGRKLTWDLRASRRRMEKCSAVGSSDVNCRICNSRQTASCLDERNGPLTILMPCHVASDNAKTPAREFNL
jgi:hypothetical protein